MPVVRILPGGSSGGFAGPGRSPDDDGSKRGKIRGWSASSARRMTSWLWSVHADALPDQGGLAVTFTTGETPASAAEWTAARKELLRSKVIGAERVHWVTEWTAIGRPHLHAAVYGVTAGELLARWFRICDSYGWPVSVRGQHIAPIVGVSGWLEYVSKHAARGVRHYQRQGAPEGWDSTGRLWGWSGEWPRTEPVEVDLERHEFYRYRRLVRAYLRSRLRAVGAHRAAKQLGSMWGDKDKGAMMGLGYWIPDSVSYTLVLYAVETATEPNI